MSSPSPMIMAGRQTGGAIMPSSEPMAMIAAVWTRGMPRFIITGATNAPVVKTQAVEEPVMAPGNRISSMSTMSSSEGFR